MEKVFLTMTKKYILEVCVLIIILLMISIKWTSLHVPHSEFDEQIYITLSKQIYYEGVYTLQGTEILNKLNKEIYDTPIFFHPPLFALISIPFILWLGDSGAVIVSWLGHFLMLSALALFLRDLLGKNNILITVMVLFLCATDPLMFFISKKIWLDSILTGLVSLSMYLFWKAYNVEQRKLLYYLFFSGLFFGLALATKIPAVLITPYYFIILCSRRIWNINIREILCFSLPIILLGGPWFIITYMEYGKLIYAPPMPDSLLNSNKYLQMVTSRPPYYFLKQFFLLTPIIILPITSVIISNKKTPTISVGMWAAFIGVIAGYTYFAVANNQAYVMRYVSPACFPFYVLLAQSFVLNSNAGKTKITSSNYNFIFILYVVFILSSLVLNAMTMLFYVFNYKFDTIYSIFEIL